MPSSASKLRRASHTSGSSLDISRALRSITVTLLPKRRTALEEFWFLGIQFISYQENIDTSSASGQALFAIVSAVLQLERDLIRERVSAGIRNARASGKKLGRPKRTLDREVILKLKAQGLSLRQIAVCVFDFYAISNRAAPDSSLENANRPLVRMTTSFNSNDVNLME
jgi:hypothetical protein